MIFFFTQKKSNVKFMYGLCWCGEKQNLKDMVFVAYSLHFLNA